VLEISFSVTKKNYFGPNICVIFQYFNEFFYNYQANVEDYFTAVLFVCLMFSYFIA